MFFSRSVCLINATSKKMFSVAINMCFRWTVNIATMSKPKPRFLFVPQGLSQQFLSVWDQQWNSTRFPFCCCRWSISVRAGEWGFAAVRGQSLWRRVSLLVCWPDCTERWVLNLSAVQRSYPVKCCWCQLISLENLRGQKHSEKPETHFWI